jgi:hypothetical protein
MLLHPLFPHVHGDLNHAALEAENGFAEIDTSLGDQAGAPSVFDQAPGISALAGDLGAHDIISGVLLPLFLAAALLEHARRLPLTEPRPEQRTLAPPSPPPRQPLIAQQALQLV